MTELKGLLLKRIEALLDKNKDVKEKIYPSGKKKPKEVYFIKPPTADMSDSDLLWTFEMIVWRCYMQR